MDWVLSGTPCGDADVLGDLGEFGLARRRSLGASYGVAFFASDAKNGASCRDWTPQVAKPGIRCLIYWPTQA